MHLSNEIVLRPRFRKSLAHTAQACLECFSQQAKITTAYKISRVDGHVFIRIPKSQQHFWSPQLHLEIVEDETNGTILKGLFGPNPTVWTMFMFFHFVIAGLFIAAGVWLYKNVSLNEPITLPLSIMIGFVLIWFILYFAGRLGRKAGAEEMKGLYAFMKQTLNKIKE